MNAPSDRVKSIFLQAIERHSPEEWPEFLDQACADDAELREGVEKLLHAQQELESFHEPARPLAATIDPLPGECLGTMLGPYKLLQQIGEGGMGVVFMAEQTEPVRRRVAVKVIKPGMDSRQVIARFEAERQALALMDHINIARVLDAGATEAGRPYFVMELVRGVPITKYCDDNHLTPRQRLELFLPVCQAIHHAHQKGIIHRDLKPSNVMVTLYDGKPVAKVIDFGVAKATEQKLTERTLFTQYGTLVGTFEYMSPEQAEMSALGVDTRSDIYSLGVMLYELLTGSTPLTHKQATEAAYAEILRRIKEDEPPKPSTRLSDSGEALASISAQRNTEPARLAKLLRGELDWIVMKCLEKDRNRRYETANSFAADLQRYLDDEPVQACPPSARYRFGKFARRNKGPVLAASLVALALIGGVIGTTWGMLRATEAEADAKREARDKIAALAEKETALATATANETRAKAAQQDAQANLKDALAAVDQMLTRVAEDKLSYVPQMELVRRDLLEDALKFYQKFFQKQSDDSALHREAALAYRRVGRIHQQLGQNQDAERDYRKLIEMFDSLGPEAFADPALLREMINGHLEFSWALNELSKGEEAAQSIRRAVELADRLDKEVPGNRVDIVNARNYLAGVLLSNQQPGEAEEVLKKNLALADDTFSLEAVHRVLGDVFMATARLLEAEESYRQALNYAEQLVQQHPSANWLKAAFANDQRNLAGAISANHRAAEAEEIQRGAILILDQLAADYPHGPAFGWNLARALIEEAGFLKHLGQTADAEKAYRRAIDLYERLANDFPTMPNFSATAFDQRLNLGQFLNEFGKTEEALQEYRDACSIVTNPSADARGQFAHWLRLFQAQIALGQLLVSAGKNQEAEAQYAEALTIRDRLEKEFADKAEFQRDLAASHLNMGHALYRVGRMDERRKSLQMALSHAQKWVDVEPRGRESRALLAEIYSNVAGQSGESEETARKAIALNNELATEFPKVPEYRLSLAYAHNNFGWRLRESNGRLPEAEKEHRQSQALFEEVATEFPAAHWARADCAELLYTVAAYPRDRGELAEARQLLEQAIHRLELFLQSNPQNPLYRWRLGNYLSNLADVLLRSGKSGEADDAYRQAASVLETLVRDYPNALEYRAELGHRRRERAFRLWGAGNTEEAEKLFWEALNDFEKLSAAFPDVAGHRHFLADTHRVLGRLLALRKQFPEAENAYRRSIEIHEERMVRFPDQPVTEGADEGQQLRELYASYFDFADFLLTTGREQEAEPLWQKAADNLDRIGARSVSDTYVMLRYWEALARLKAGDVTGYRGACDAMLDRLGQTDKPDVAHWLAWAAVLAPQAVDDANRPVALAERAVASDPSNGQFSNTLGAALYRAERFGDAVAMLNQVNAAWEQAETKPINYSPAYSWFFLALAHQRLGHAEETRRWFDKAVAWAEQEIKSQGVAWNRRLTLELLRREAESVINEAAVTPPTDTNEKTGEKD